MDKINLKAVLLQNMGEDSADFLPMFCNNTAFRFPTHHGGRERTAE